MGAVDRMIMGLGGELAHLVHTQAFHHRIVLSANRKNGPGQQSKEKQDPDRNHLQTFSLGTEQHKNSVVCSAPTARCRLLRTWTYAPRRSMFSGFVLYTEFFFNLKENQDLPDMFVLRHF
jgi:hypothetical protein